MTDFPYLEDHNELMKIRHEKINSLAEKGHETYPSKVNLNNFFRSTIVHELCKEYDSVDDIPRIYDVSVRGRIRSMRLMGNVAFFDLHDFFGKIQIVCFKKEMPEDFEMIKKSLIDIGDIVAIEGKTFVTKAGENSIRAYSIQFLSKAIRPLPEKREGIKDSEAQIREREAYFIANEEAKANLITRSKLISNIREFLSENSFMEVETPMLHHVPGGATAKPFSTHYNALHQDMYLRVAPELYLKRLLVSGFENIYEINKSFRNEGISKKHNPEFTMLELYAAYADCDWLIKFTKKMLSEVLNFSPKFKIDFYSFELWTMIDALDIYGHVEVHWDDKMEDVRQQMPDLPLEIDNVEDAVIWGFENYVEHKLIKPTFITEIPKKHSPLAKSIEGYPNLADRFELFINGMEIANGYSELNNPQEQFEIFKNQTSKENIDVDYIRALEYGMPPAAGLGVGIDRLAMLLTNTDSIKDVIAFPTLRRK